MQNREHGWNVSMTVFLFDCLFVFLMKRVSIKLKFEGPIVIKIVEEKRVKDKTTSRDRTLHS